MICFSFAYTYMLRKKWLVRYPLVDKLNKFYDVACVLKKFYR